MPANPSPGAATGVGLGADMYLHVHSAKAGKIKGESTSPGHVDDIQLSGWHWGLAVSTAMGSVEATSRRAWTALTVTKQIDRSTTGLMSSLAQNAVIKEAKLTMRRSGSGQQDYLTITLNDARITRVEHSVAADGSTVETVAFAFTQVNVEYRQQQLGGLVGGGYSFVDQMLPN